MKRFFLFLTSLFFFSSAIMTEPATYVVQNSHTFPSFEADHQGGLSIWRGKITKTSGTIILDKENESGQIDVVMDMNSIDFGWQPMTDRFINDIYKTEEFPVATYKATLANFVNGAPTLAEGILTLQGISKPVNLSIDKFQCQPHFRRPSIEACGADASATINRADFDIMYDLPMFFPQVKLLINVEAYHGE